MNEVLELEYGGVGMVFRSPERLWVILVLALLFAALLLWKYGAARRALKNLWVKEHLLGARVPSFLSHIGWFTLLLLATALIASVWAEGERMVKIPKPVYGNIRIAFLLDSSLSMNYGEDVAPTRLAAAKKVVAEFVEKLSVDPELDGKYSLALIPFSGVALPFYSSFTTSKGEFLLLLGSINTETITRPGTNLLAAVLGYKTLLERYPPPDGETLDLAIIISDGGKGEVLPGERRQIEKALRAFGPRVVRYAVGIGSKGPDGRTKPVKLIVRAPGGEFVDYLREKPEDKKSKILTSELDEAMLKLLVTPTPEDTGVRKKNYRFLSEREELVAAFKDLVLRTRVPVGVAYSYRYEPILPWLLLPAFAVFFFFFGFGGWIGHYFIRFFSFLFNRLR